MGTSGCSRCSGCSGLLYGSLRSQYGYNLGMSLCERQCSRPGYKLVRIAQSSEERLGRDTFAHIAAARTDGSSSSRAASSGSIGTCSSSDPKAWIAAVLTCHAGSLRAVTSSSIDGSPEKGAWFSPRRASTVGKRVPGTLGTFGTPACARLGGQSPSQNGSCSESW